MANPSTNHAPQLPSETVRGLVNLFLIIHLFALALVMTGFLAPSVFQRQLMSALGPYLRTFNFDLRHVYPVARPHLTHASPQDVDFRIQGQAKTADGSLQPWSLPRPGLFPPIRRQRDQTLANAVGGLMESDNENQESLLPRALAAAELRKAGAKSGTITVTAHYLQEIDDLSAVETRLRDPHDASYYRPVFEAGIIANYGGSFDLLKSAAAGEVAPVTGASGSRSKPAPANQNQQE